MVNSVPAYKCQAVVLSDTVEYSPPARGFILASSGNVKITDTNGNETTLPSMAAGIVHPIQVTKVHSTGTGAVGSVVLVW